jgi:hypothetical protein
MASNNINTISATGLKSVEIDELNTPQITIKNEGLQYFYKYNILIPTVIEGFYNLQEEMDNIMISDTTQDFELLQSQNGLSTTNANLSSVATLAGGAATNVLSAIDIANQKNWIIFWHASFNYNVTTNHVYLNIKNRCEQ